MYVVYFAHSLLPGLTWSCTCEDFSRKDYEGPPITNILDIIDYVKPTALLGLSTIPVCIPMLYRLSILMIFLLIRVHSALLLSKRWLHSTHDLLSSHSPTLSSSPSALSKKPWNIPTARCSSLRGPHSRPWNTAVQRSTLAKETICISSLVCLFARYE